MDAVTLEARERAKYERVWEFDQYRVTAPGEEAVDNFLEAVKPPAGTSVIDFGCGTGRPAMALITRGLGVLGVDFAANCLDLSLRSTVRLVVACLWDLPPGLEAEWGFCTDVMEHIPPERVRDTLTCIAGATRLGCFFQIATTPDRMGPKLLGEPLHLTVHGVDWWADELARHFHVAIHRPSRWGATFLCLHDVAD